MNQVYNIENLSVGIVECFKNNKAVTEIHALAQINNYTQTYDLDLCQVINSNGEKEVYFPITLISYKELLMDSSINWGSVSREDALKIKNYLSEKYLKFLRVKRISLTLRK